jgi:hypothetical protein
MAILSWIKMADKNAKRRMSAIAAVLSTAAVSAHE